MKLADIMAIAKKFDMNVEFLQIYNCVITDGIKRVDIFTNLDGLGRGETKFQYWPDYTNEPYDYSMITDEIIFDTTL